MLAFTAEVLFVTSARSLCLLATYRDKVSNQRDAGPCKEGDINRKVSGSNPSADKGLFLAKCSGTIILSWNLYFFSKSCTMY